jgi:hypothetical protein
VDLGGVALAVGGSITHHHRGDNRTARVVIVTTAVRNA